jgi:hypothetical protein
LVTTAVVGTGVVATEDGLRWWQLKMESFEGWLGSSG